MAGAEYQQRIQRALDYIETHLESSITLDDLASEASYSPGHFVWIFRTATGFTPIDYVRCRRMTEAARAVLAGNDIVDTAYRYGFSAQDAFTRSFGKTIGFSPGRLRQIKGKDGTYTPALDLEREGGRWMLNYNLDCDALDSVLRVEQLLTEEVRDLVARIATGTMGVRSIDPHIAEELRQARVVRFDGDVVRIDTAVFLEDDLLRIHPATERWGADLAKRIIDSAGTLPAMTPDIKRLLVGMNGIDQGVFELLISGGYAFDHRATKGRYAGAKIDFYEVCDAYDRFGPYLSGGYGFHGDRFAVKIIGDDQGIYGFLNAGVGLANEGQYAFRTNVNKYLTDVFGDLLQGRAAHPSLSAAAEGAGLTKSGKCLVPVITESEAPAYSKVVRTVRGVIAEFLRSTAPDMQTFLKDTLPGRQGVAPSKLMVDLMRYVRMIIHKALYDRGFYTDSLLEKGNITVFRELNARIDGK